jgi:hypothetical protein
LYFSFLKPQTSPIWDLELLLSALPGRVADTLTLMKEQGHSLCATKKLAVVIIEVAMNLCAIVGEGRWETSYLCNVVLFETSK